MDRRGNVFYTDLAHVWRIAPDGSKAIAVQDVHTHELVLDSAGNLFGEDSEYLGGDRWRHRIWRLSPNGRLADVIPWRAGFLQDYEDFGFVRDRSGAMYWVRAVRRTHTEIRKRTPDGRVTTIPRGVRFGFPMNWLAAAPDGNLYVADGSSLRRVDRRGQLSTVVHGRGPKGDRHFFGGIWPDAGGNIYVANTPGRSVVRVSPTGRTAVVARTPPPWAPTGVLVAPNGALWILEYSTSNQARVRRFTQGGRSTVF
jgi:sugar lactone lactonase YvrE